MLQSGDDDLGAQAATGSGLAGSGNVPNGGDASRGVYGVQSQGVGGAGTATLARPQQQQTEEEVGQVTVDTEVRTESEQAEDHVEVAQEAAEQGEGEASQESLSEVPPASEAAHTDFRNVEGWVEAEQATGGESAEGARSLLLPEVGSALPEGQAEFLAIGALLGKVVPILASTLGPVIAKRIAPRLRQRTRKVLQSRLSGGDQIAVLARLLRQGQRAPGGESAEGVDINDRTLTEMVEAIEVIIGTDDRVRIQNTSQVPWRRICALRITFPNGANFLGTGFFIGARTVATAGHCVYLPKQGGWARRIEVIPGLNGPQRPFGSALATSFRAAQGWVQNGRPAADYGAVVLPPGSFSGQNLGRFGFGVFPSSVLLAKQVVLAGYPGDKPGEMWGMARRLKSVTGDTLIYDIDTMGGQSGAGPYIKHNGKRYVVGIHNYGATSGNSATRITAPVYNNLLSWSKL